MAHVCHQFPGGALPGVLLQKRRLHGSLRLVIVFRPAGLRQDEGCRGDVPGLLHLRHLDGDGVNFRVFILPEAVNFGGALAGEPGSHGQETQEAAERNGNHKRPQGLLPGPRKRPLDRQTGKNLPTRHAWHAQKHVRRRTTQPARPRADPVMKNYAQQPKPPPAVTPGRKA